MNNWFRVACLTVGAGLAFASIASDEKAGPAAGAEAGTVRPGTVVEIKPNRIYLMDVEKGFDVVVSTEGLEHLEHAFGFLREARRVLRPGGRLLLTTPNTLSLRSRVRFFGSGFYHTDPRPLDESRRHPLHHIGLRTYPELRYMLHTGGFRLQLVAPTHVKPVSYLYAPLAPWMWLYTRIAFRKEKDPAQRARNREILSTLLSPAVLFGENLMLLARH